MRSGASGFGGDRPAGTGQTVGGGRWRECRPFICASRGTPSDTRPKGITHAQEPQDQAKGKEGVGDVYGALGTIPIGKAHCESFVVILLATTFSSHPIQSGCSSSWP